MRFVVEIFFCYTYTLVTPVRCLHVPHTCRCCSRFNAGYYTSQLTSQLHRVMTKFVSFFFAKHIQKGLIEWMNERTMKKTLLFVCIFEIAIQLCTYVRYKRYISIYIPATRKTYAFMFTQRHWHCSSCALARISFLLRLHFFSIITVNLSCFGTNVEFSVVHINWVKFGAPPTKN